MFQQKISEKFLVKIILAVLVFASVSTILGVAGYLAKNKSVKISQPQVSPVTKPETISQVIDETADLSSKALATEDWKTYRNQVFLSLLTRTKAI